MFGCGGKIELTILSPIMFGKFCFTDRLDNAVANTERCRDPDLEIIS